MIECLPQKKVVSPQIKIESNQLILICFVAIFNLNEVPDLKKDTSLRCKICDGKMREQSIVFTDWISLLVLKKDFKINRYKCDDCGKELVIREK